MSDELYSPSEELYRPLAERAEDEERPILDIIRDEIAACKGNVSEAARNLHVSRQTLYDHFAREKVRKAKQEERRKKREG